MDADEASGSSAPDDKNQKRSDECSPSDISTVGETNPADVIVVQTGDIFKLDIDCFEESFDYLPYRDLVNVGKTCKRLQQVAGYCFQQNYLGIAVLDAKGIRAEFDKHDKVDIKHFTRFIQEISVNSHGLLRFIDSQSKFLRLKTIAFKFLQTADDMNRFEDIALNKVEVLRMRFCVLNNNFHEVIDQCVKLRHLEIERCDTGYNLFTRKYPTLEYFKIDPICHLEVIKSIPMCLELNQNIRKFATTSSFLWNNRHTMGQSYVKLDDLAIEVRSHDIDKFRSLCDWLNERQELGFYKKLQLYFTFSLRQKDIDQLATLNGLVKLNIFNSSHRLVFPALKTLQELFIYYVKDVTDLEMLPNNLINVKRIHFRVACSDDIMPFIRQSVKMQKIKIDQLWRGVHFNGRIIDLRALNREREQLPEADKITLYVKEEIYLATKWALGETDFGLIRLKRLQSFEWHHDFD